MALVVSALKEGRLVILPTETVYGLAADPTLPGAMEQIFKAKGRPDDKPIPLLASDAGTIENSGCDLGRVGRKLAAAFWPGPLTLVVKTSEGFKGFRVPDYPVTQAVLRPWGRLLAVTSANRSGEPAATRADEAAQALGSSVAYVLDAGPSPGGVPSTVVKIDGDRIEILREGAILKQRILEAAQA